MAFPVQYRRLKSGLPSALFHRFKLLACLFLLVLFVTSFILFYCNSNDELNFLREQVKRLKDDLADAGIKMNSMRHSELECRANLGAIESELKGCQKGTIPFAGVRLNNNGWADEGHPLRGDMAVPDQPLNVQKIAIRPNQQIDNNYPRLSREGNFIPTRLWVHLDLKGASFKTSYFLELLRFLSRLDINGIVVEWEDMFPYTGQLSSVVNGDAYSMEQLNSILGKARELKMEVVPLVQTFGHLEWVLKAPQFAHLREDPRYPQVICFGAPESWDLLTDMITQVADVHKRFGMNYFHMGADEIFYAGVCNQSVVQIKHHGSREKAMLWHISRIATFVKEHYSVTVLAWHDILVQMMEQDLQTYHLPERLEPVLWSYAEDLDMYLPYSSWIALKPFRNVWGASAFKGADGPTRFSSNPLHYIRNHESWIEQMSRVYKHFDSFQGLIITGWSRYDHLAVLCELFPVGIPALAMSVETILAGKPLNGHYKKSMKMLECNVPQSQGYVFGCKFPGSKVYELVNEFAAQSQQSRKYLGSDFDFNGWVSVIAEKENYSSPLVIEKVLPYIDFYLQPLERIERDLHSELRKYFHKETADEFILTYVSRDLEFLRVRKHSAQFILQRNTFPVRPFIKYVPQRLLN